MKTLRLIIPGAVAFLFLSTSCQRDSNEETVSFQNQKTIESQEAVQVNARSNSGPCNLNAYIVTLESRTLVNGYWEWVWSVQNPNPGNGNNGTSQDLSHWGMQLGSCVNFASVISAGYSSDGSSWINFTPSYEIDPGQGCFTTPVLKFDFGTTGTAKTYYRLVINQDVEAGTVVGYYKSGSRTSCCTFSFTGLNCGGPVEIVE